MDDLHDSAFQLDEDDLAQLQPTQDPAPSLQPPAAAAAAAAAPSHGPAPSNQPESFIDDIPESAFQLDADDLAQLQPTQDPSQPSLQGPHAAAGPPQPHAAGLPQAQGAAAVAAVAPAARPAPAPESFDDFGGMQDMDGIDDDDIADYEAAVMQARDSEMQDLLGVPDDFEEEDDTHVRPAAAAAPATTGNAATTGNSAGARTGSSHASAVGAQTVGQVQRPPQGASVAGQGHARPAAQLPDAKRPRTTAAPGTGPLSDAQVDALFDIDEDEDMGDGSEQQQLGVLDVEVAAQQEAIAAAAAAAAAEVTNPPPRFIATEV